MSAQVADGPRAAQFGRGAVSPGEAPTRVPMANTDACRLSQSMAAGQPAPAATACTAAATHRATAAAVRRTMAAAATASSAVAEAIALAEAPTASAEAVTRLAEAATVSAGAVIPAAATPAVAGTAAITADKEHLSQRPGEVLDSERLAGARCDLRGKA